MKPAGNPIAAGSDRDADPGAGVALRLVEATGLGGTATVTTAWSWTDAHRADLLERPDTPIEVDDRSFTVQMAGSTVETIIARPDEPAPPGGDPLGPSGELVRPVFSRYWLHNRGPAPMGYLPVSVAVSPALVSTGDNLEVVLASQLTDGVREGVVELHGPAGWTVEPASRVYGLGPGQHLRFGVTVTPPPGAEAGLYFLAARITDGDGAIEDVTTLVHGAPAEFLPVAGDETPDPEAAKGTAAEAGRATGLDIAATQAVVLAPGGSGSVTVRLTNRTRDEIRGETQLVSPWGTWSWLPRLSSGFVVPAGGTAEVTFPVEVPAGEPAAHAWALPKVMWFGRTQYAQAVHLEVKR
jgi:hypothetical protein